LCRNDLEVIQKNLNDYRDELTKLLNQNEKLEANESNAKSIQNDIIIIDSYINDIKRHQKEEQHLVTIISECGSNRSLQEAINEQTTLKNTLNNICNVLEKKQNEVNVYNEKFHELQAQQSKIKTDELNIKIKMQDEKSILDKLKDLQNLEATLSIELDIARDTIEPIQKELEICIKNLEQNKKQHIKIIENDRKKVFFLT